MVSIGCNGWAAIYEVLMMVEGYSIMMQALPV